MAFEHIAGKKVADIKLYALSTCPWCRKTKQFLNSLGVEYDFVDVDLLQGNERNNTIGIVKKWNPSGSFPVIVIDDQKAVVGFREDEIRERLKR